MVNPGNEISSLDFKNIIGGPLVAVIEAQAQAALSTVNYIKTAGFNADGEVVYVSFQYPKEISPFRAGNEGQVINVNVTNSGSGYTAAPKVTFGAPPSGGREATGEARLSNGKVTEIVITDSGQGYTAAPTVTLDPPPTGGSGSPVTAEAKAEVGANKDVKAVTQQMELRVPILTMLPIPYIRIEEMSLNFNVKINSMETYNVSDQLSVGGTLEANQGWGTGSVKLKVSSSYKRTTAAGRSVERTYDMAVHVRAVQDETPGGLETILGILEQAVTSAPIKKN